MNNLKIGILRNEDPNSGNKWSLACKKKGVSHDIIDITASNWLDIISSNDYHFFLLKPPGNFEHFKKIYDERIYILSKVLRYSVFPSYEECYIYENKKLLSDFLKAQKLPHPFTRIFYNKIEAIQYLTSTKFPLVAKTTIGASGSGVRILKNNREANRYIEKAFSSIGIKRRSGPNQAIGTPTSRLRKAIKNPTFLLKKLKQYYSIYKHGEKDYVIFQEYIAHEFEWRMIKIGDSYFGHKKIKYKDKASGSKEINYTSPPEKLLNFTKGLCDSLNYNFMAVDLFEDGRGGYLINELQTMFGHVQDFVLEVDGKRGRYVFQNNHWIFESGDFNTNESYDLRLQAAIELYQKGLY